MKVDKNKDFITYQYKKIFDLNIKLTNLINLFLFYHIIRTFDNFASSYIQNCIMLRVYYEMCYLNSSFDEMMSNFAHLKHVSNVIRQTE